MSQNVILLSTPKSSKLPRSFRLSDQNFVWVSLLISAYYMSHPFHPRLITPVILREECKLWRPLLCTEHCVQFSSPYVSFSSDTAWYDHHCNVCRRTIIEKHLSMQFCSFCRCMWAVVSVSSPLFSTPLWHTEGLYLPGRWLSGSAWPCW